MVGGTRNRCFGATVGWVKRLCGFAATATGLWLGFSAAVGVGEIWWALASRVGDCGLDFLRSPVRRKSGGVCRHRWPEIVPNFPRRGPIRLPASHDGPTQTVSVRGGVGHKMVARGPHKVRLVVC